MKKIYNFRHYSSFYDKNKKNIIYSETISIENKDYFKRNLINILYSSIIENRFKFRVNFYSVYMSSYKLIQTDLFNCSLDTTNLDDIELDLVDLNRYVEDIYNSVINDINNETISDIEIDILKVKMN